MIRRIGCLLLVCFLQACSVMPPPDPMMPGQKARNMVVQRISAVMVTDHDDASRWANSGFPVTCKSGEADGGSATPISPDGYFLTANHVLARMAGRKVFVIYGCVSSVTPVLARVVWRSARADLALLHIPVPTGFYYQWTYPDRWLPEGSGVIHGGIATGLNAKFGKLSTSLAPESAWTVSRKFKIDIPLQPGDSGGPVVDAYGALVGVNSAVEFLVPMETAFFVDSEATRPNTRRIESLMRSDRSRNNYPAPP